MATYKDGKCVWDAGCDVMDAACKMATINGAEVELHFNDRVFIVQPSHLRQALQMYDKEVYPGERETVR